MSKAAMMMTPDTTTVVLSPLLACTNSVISRVTVLNMIDPYAPFSASTLASPGRAEQESESQRHRHGRVGTVLDRLVERLDEFIRDLAHRIDCLAAFVLCV